MAEGSKTEKATPKRRQDERKKGNVFMSQDAVAVATLLGSWAALWLTAGTIADQLGRTMLYCLEICKGGSSVSFLGQVSQAAHQAILAAVKSVLPIALVTVVCAVAATFAQTRFLVSGELLRPKFSRVNPLEGFKRLFSLKSVVDTVKNLLKICLLLIIIFFSLKGMFQESSRYLYTDVRTAGAYLFAYGRGMVIRIVLAFVALAALDVLYQWWDYERRLRMSKEEIKEEYKQTEGDPKVKGKIREIQRRRAQQRMMQQVPSADVVIRNPTHFAVALRYRPEQDDAPVVLAKGQDSLALRIVQVAEQHGVAVIENVPLARSLYAQAELEREIPPELYEAVAEVLVYIFRLDQDKKLVK